MACRKERNDKRNQKKFWGKTEIILNYNIILICFVYEFVHQFYIRLYVFTNVCVF